MDLNSIVAAAVAGNVAPRLLTLYRSAGYVTNVDGSRTPSYAEAVTVLGAVQNLTYRDIQQTEGLNLQGTRRGIYLHGDWRGLIRSSQQGGDLIVLPDGTLWLVAQVLEAWPHWTKVAATLQNPQVTLIDDSGGTTLTSDGGTVLVGVSLPAGAPDGAPQALTDDAGDTTLTSDDGTSVETT